MFRRRKPAMQPDARHRARNFDETRPVAHPKGSLATPRERLVHKVRAWLWDLRKRGAK